jgi:lysophospholipase L1-like esterase
MKASVSYTAVLLFLLLPLLPAAQPMPVNDNALSSKYPFITAVFNRVVNSSGLDSFYRKLYRLKSTHTGVVSVVHIGDSHIQADFLSGVVRSGLQDFFGDAGRGLVFPYQLAQSNAPPDISSSSATRWQYNRLTHPEVPVSYGISGYGIQTSSFGAGFNLSLKTGAGSFNRLKFFIDSNTSVSWILQAENNDVPYMIKKEEGDVLPFQQVDLEQPAAGISLSSLPSADTKAFYGVSLENSGPGVLYHTIGVNGARYDQYNMADLFWQQLPGLHADLFIVSLGTNEAQRTGFMEAAFTTELLVFIEKLKQASPGAAILLTTAPDSYKGRRSNAVLRSLNTFLANYCNRNYIPLWDLYRVTNGYGSAYSWARRGLLSRDRVHFTQEGYRVQGTLLLNALAKGYNNYISSY